MTALLGRATVLLGLMASWPMVAAEASGLTFQRLDIIEFDKKGFHPPDDESFRFDCPTDFTAIGISYQLIGPNPAQISVISSYNTGSNDGRQWGLRFYNSQDVAVRLELQIICLRNR